MHVIICGLGHIGYRAATLLARSGAIVSVVCLPTRAAWMREIEARGGTLVVGDARDPVLLEKAGLATCDAVIAATDSDVVNLEVALDVRRHRPDVPLVVRVFDATLAEEVEHALSVRRALSVSALAAPAFAGAALGDHVRGVLSLEGHRFVLGKPASSAPSGGAAIAGGLWLVPEAEWHRAHPRPAVPSLKKGRPSSLRLAVEVWKNAPAALRRLLGSLLLLMAVSVFVFGYGMKLQLLDAFYFLVTTVTTTGYGDISPKDSPAWVKLYACLFMVLGSFATATIYSMVTDFVLAERFASALGATRPPQHGHVVIVGVGNLGYRIAEELTRGGVEIAVVDLRPGIEVGSGLHGAAVTVGDARLSAVLENASAGGARALVAVTGDDAVNLAVGLGSVRKHHIPAVVRLFDADFARKASTLSLRAALSASSLAAPSFVAAAFFPGVRYAFTTDEELVAICEVTEGSEEDTGTIMRVGDRSLVVRRIALAPALS